MKIIELLDKMAKGEEVPKKIRLFGEEFIFEDNDYYSIHSSSPLISYIGENYLRAELNYEVEIIEEPKKIEKLEPVRGSDLSDLTDKDMVLRNNALIELCKTLNNMNNKINELIDEVNKLKGGK